MNGNITTLSRATAGRDRPRHAVLRSLSVELLKIRKSSIVWTTAAIFSLFLPLICALMMLIIRHPEITAHAAALRNKTQMAASLAAWPQFFDLFLQAATVGGLIVFGFVASWIFGREFSDRTLKDLLALPISRTSIVVSKIWAMLLWCLGLTIAAYGAGLGLGALLGLPQWSDSGFRVFTGNYAAATGLTILLCVPVTFVASAGKGYLPPLGYVLLTMAVAQVAGAAGLGAMTPWAVPALITGSAGPEQSHLPLVSYVFLFILVAGGLVATLLYWNRADHRR